jgi:hypothetical protein
MENVLQRPSFPGVAEWLPAWPQLGQARGNRGHKQERPWNPPSLHDSPGLISSCEGRSRVNGERTKRHWGGLDGENNAGDELLQMAG